MDIKDQLKQIADRVIKLKDQIATEAFRKINLIIGYLLLTPCVVGVIYLIKGLFGYGSIAFILGYLIENPTIDFERVNNNPFPLHFALIAIAGAYLITNNSKSNTKTGTKD
jgi:hypothetical protein